MRHTLLTSAVLLGMASALPALAQTATGARPGNDIGTGNSLPTSTSASNIDRADARSTIAPRLPTPPVGDNAGPRQFLTVAEQALARGHTGEAQEALERAETRLLDRSTDPNAVNTPDSGPMIRQITDALNALGRGDTRQAHQIVASAIASRDVASNGMPDGSASAGGMSNGAAGGMGAMGGSPSGYGAMNGMSPTATGRAGTGM
jgi:hypothetical protein